MRTLTTEELKEKLNNGDKVMVDFFATWCGPCKALIPVLESISNDFDGVEIVKMDVDQNMTLAQELGIRSVPTVILFEGKKEISRTTGANGKGYYEKIITESFNL
jgi:thioredoxin 1